MISNTLSIHDAHPYPCKYPPHAIVDYLPESGVVLDPFCGSGTTLLEAAMRGATAIGFDCNPIAILISKFKLLEVDASFGQLGEEVLAELSLAASMVVASNDQLDDFHGRDHWFGSVAQRELAALKRWVTRWQDGRIRTWLELSLSAVVNRVSYQDSETRYARVERKVEPGDVVGAFQRHARKTLVALVARGPLRGHKHRVEQADVRTGYSVDDDSVELIVTSPPYANTMDYYLYHKQRMNVLGLDFKETQTAEIGSRWEFSSMRAPKDKWRLDYGASLREMHRVLRPGAHAIVIIGDSQIAGELVNAADLTAALAVEIGFACSVIESIPLESRSRSFQASFQRPNKNEHTVKLVKV
jgi:site-specific DNA-methyltransferase (cytosine-N4-specific)